MKIRKPPQTNKKSEKKVKSMQNSGCNNEQEIREKQGGLTLRRTWKSEKEVRDFT